MATLQDTQPSPVPQNSPALSLTAPHRGVHNFSRGVPGKVQFLFVVCMAIFIAIVINHMIAAWLGLSTVVAAAYRRIGPESGPQVYCAGSSLLQFGLSWPEVSQALGQGIENWGVGGSSPSEWEVSQRAATTSNVMIIGVSVYDLNEYRLCDVRANIVPMRQTILDLWHTRADWEFSRALLSQYPLACLRKVFPTAGRSDSVLVALRRKLPKQLRASAAAEDFANSLRLPSQAVLNFGDSTARVSDWSRDRLLRRLAVAKSEVGGKHRFDGPKYLAFQRMLHRAERQGRIFVVVLPIAPAYTREALNPEEDRSFKSTLARTQAAFPKALFVRLDQHANLVSDDNFSDLMHLNGAGKRVATEAFLKQLQQQSSSRP